MIFLHTLVKKRTRREFGEASSETECALPLGQHSVQHCGSLGQHSVQHCGSFLLFCSHSLLHSGTHLFSLLVPSGSPASSFFSSMYGSAAEPRGFNSCHYSWPGCCKIKSLTTRCYSCLLVQILPELNFS